MESPNARSTKTSAIDEMWFSDSDDFFHVRFESRAFVIIARNVKWIIPTLRALAAQQADQGLRAYIPETLIRPPNAPRRFHKTFYQYWTHTVFESGRVLCVYEDPERDISDLVPLSSLDPKSEHQDRLRLLESLFAFSPKEDDGTYYYRFPTSTCHVPTPAVDIPPLSEASSTQIGVRYSDPMVISLYPADPYYLPGAVSATVLPECAFHLPFPEDILDEIRAIEDRYGFPSDKRLKVPDSPSYLEPRFDLDGLLEQTGIKDIRELVDTERLLAARAFRASIDSTAQKDVPDYDKCMFNGIKYGVYERADSRGDDEEATLHLSLFPVDYFTYLTMTQVAQRVVKTGQLPVRFEDLFPRFRCFLCSVGVNAVVLCRQNMMILTRRSKSLRQNEAMKGRPLHVSVNEGLSEKDYVTKGEVSLDQCLCRGAREELGIKNHHITRALFGEFFFTRDLFQFGVTAIIQTTLGCQDVYHLPAQDRKIEVGSMRGWPFTLADIQRLLDRRSHKMVRHGAFTLSSIAKRELLR